MRISPLIHVALFGAVAQSLVFDAPAATAVFRAKHAHCHDADPALPAVTAGPRIGEVELLKRDFEQTVLVAPGSTCGFFAASKSNAAYDCDAGYTCSLYLSLYTISSTAYGAVACDGFDIITGCVGSKDYLAGTRCADKYCIACLSTAAPYCNFVTMTDYGVRDFFCASTTINAYQILATTSALLSVKYTTSSFLVPESQSSSLLSSLQSIIPTAPSSVPLSTTTVPAATTPAQNGGGGGGGGSSGPPLGAIIGGTVGGVAVLALIGATIFFLMRKKRRNAADNGQQAYNAPQQPYNPNIQGPPPGPPMNQAAAPTYGAAPAVVPQAWDQKYDANTQNQGYELRGMEPPYVQPYAPQGGPPTYNARDSILSSVSSPSYGSPGYGSPHAGFVSPQSTGMGGFNNQIPENQAQLNNGVGYQTRGNVHEIAG